MDIMPTEGVDTMPTEQISEFQIMLGAIQVLGGISPEELYDAMIALLLENNVEAKAIGFSENRDDDLPINIINFVGELKHHVLYLCQILEEQMSD